MTEFTLSDEVKQQTILTAALIAGKGATSDDVAGEVKRIAGFLQPGSAVQYAFTDLAKQAERTTETKHLIGTLLGLGKESTSNRGVLIFRTKVHDEHAIEGKEILRTEIASGPGSVGSDHLNRIKTMVGQKLRVSFALEKMANGRSARILRDFTSLGPDPEYKYDADVKEYHPFFYEDVVKQKALAKVERILPAIPTRELVNA